MLVYKSAWMVDNGQRNTMWASMAKLLAADHCNKVRVRTHARVRAQRRCRVIACASHARPHTRIGNSPSALIIGAHDMLPWLCFLA